MDILQNYILPRLHSSITSSSSVADLHEQVQFIRTAYFDPYILDPANDLLTSATPNILSFFLLLVILFISLRVLGYVLRMITFWVMLVMRLVFWAAFLGSAWYIYTVGFEKAARDLGWVWGIIEGFIDDFQPRSAKNSGKAPGAAWYPGQEYLGRNGAYGDDAWGRGGRGL